MTDQVLLISLGGTISMTADASGAAVPSLPAAEIAGRAGLADVVAEDRGRRPGAHLSFDDVVALAAHIDAVGGRYRGVVVVQGTDTIEEVAFALDLLCRGDTTIVVTGAMRHASALSADGAGNLADAVAVARDEPCRGLGVLVVMAGQIHAASRVRKAHPFAVDAFESSPGSLGWVVEGRPTIALRPARAYTLDRAPAAAPRTDATVEMVTALLGATSRALERLVADPPDGLVVEGFGAGHVPLSWIEPLTELAGRVPVVLCSRSRVGPILHATYGFDGSETDLLRRGLISAGWLDGPKAAVALRLLLGRGADRAEIEAFFAG